MRRVSSLTIFFCETLTVSAQLPGAGNGAGRHDCNRHAGGAIRLSIVVNTLCILVKRRRARRRMRIRGSVATFAATAFVLVFERLSK